MAGLTRITEKITRQGRRALGVVLLAFFCLPAWAADISVGNSPFDQGFRLMYDLEFDRAHQFFSSWQREHPEDPVSPAADAAGFLFSEFQRLGVLEAQFYENDKAFNARKKLAPDPEVRDRFNLALDQSEGRARALLEKNPKDRDALFAMTLSSGLRADYAALIEKRNLASMRYTKESTKWSEQLLAVDPQCYDGYIASGISKYIIGSMAAPVRWLMRLGGVSGDKKAGIAELQLTAERGRYLAPFARILLAIAYVREKDKPRARELLAALRDDYPKNPLFAREIARLDSGQ
jgi:tetrahydromethanopterin S-methyltransferase subunit F